MATGFVNRWKGKVAVPYGNIWQNGLKSAAVFLTTAAPSTALLANLVPAGALVADTVNKALYQNTGTQAAPAFSALTISTTSGIFIGTFDGLVGSVTPAAGVFTKITDGVSAVSTGGGTIGNGGITTIASGSGITAYPLTAPVAGVIKRLEITSVSSGVQIVASTAGGALVTVGGAVNTVIKSTVVSSIELIGLSTALWGIQSAYPSSTVFTLSTTT